MKKFIVAALVLISSFSFASGFKEFQHGMTKKSVIELSTGDCKTDSKWCSSIKPKVEMTLFGFPISSMSATFDGEGLDSKLTKISVSVDKSQREFNTVAVKALGKPIVFKTTSLQGNNLTVYMWKMKDGSFIETTWVDQNIDGTPTRNFLGGGVSLFKSATLDYVNQESGLQEFNRLSKASGKENTKDF